MWCWITCIKSENFEFQDKYFVIFKMLVNLNKICINHCSCFFCTVFNTGR